MSAPRLWLEFALGAVMIFAGGGMWGYWLGKSDAITIRAAQHDRALATCAERGLLAFQNLRTGAVICRSDAKPAPTIGGRS